MAMLTSIKGYWKLDESSGNASDASTNAVTLTNNNTVTYATEKINNGAVFASASSQYLSAAWTTALNCTTSDMSVAGWVKFTTTPSSGNSVGIIGMYNGGTNNDRAYLCYLKNNSGTLELHYIVNTGSNSDVLVAWTPTTATLYHIAVTYNKTSGAVNFYVNGAQQGTTQTANTGGPHSVSGSAVEFWLGDYYDGSAHHYLNGALDEVGLWARELSSSEASQLYNSGSGLAYPLPTNVVINTASYTATARTAVLNVGLHLSTITQTYIVTTYGLTPHRTIGWTNGTQHSSTWTNQGQMLT